MSEITLNSGSKTNTEQLAIPAIRWEILRLYIGRKPECLDMCLNQFIDLIMAQREKELARE